MRHDYLLGYIGHASQAEKAKFRDKIKHILNADGWGRWLMLSGLTMANGLPPSPTRLTDWLKRAIKNSEKKGYHKAGMDFRKVHRSGGSRLLQKGDKVELGRLANIVIRDTWRYKGSVSYLDASVILYDFSGKRAGIADYAHNAGASGLYHSGDVINFRESRGMHTIRVSMADLSRDVSSLFVVLSAWDEAVLDDIFQPCVTISNADSGNELSRYELDSRRDTVSGCKSVIMCRLHRRVYGGAWKVEAIGAVQEFGDAQCYEPIFRTLERHLEDEQKRLKH